MSLGADCLATGRYAKSSVEGGIYVARKDNNKTRRIFSIINARHATKVMFPLHLDKIVV